MVVMQVSYPFLPSRKLAVMTIKISRKIYVHAATSWWRISSFAELLTISGIDSLRFLTALAKLLLTHTHTSKYYIQIQWFRQEIGDQHDSIVTKEKRKQHNINKRQRFSMNNKSTIQLLLTLQSNMTANNNWDNGEIICFPFMIYRGRQN